MHRQVTPLQNPWSLLELVMTVNQWWQVVAVGGQTLEQHQAKNHRCVVIQRHHDLLPVALHHNLYNVLCINIITLAKLQQHIFY